MEKEKKDIKNYNPQKFTSIGEDLEEFTLYSIPMRLSLTDGILTLIVKVYKKEQFENNEVSTSTLNREFEIDYLEAKKQFPKFFAELEKFSFEWLDISAKKYDLQMFDIDLFILKMCVNARHKIRLSREMPDETKTVQEFEEMKIKNLELLMGYFAFARTYAAQNDKKLALFK